MRNFIVKGTVVPGVQEEFSSTKVITLKSFHTAFSMAVWIMKHVKKNGRETVRIIYDEVYDGKFGLVSKTERYRTYLVTTDFEAARKWASEFLKQNPKFIFGETPNFERPTAL